MVKLIFAIVTPIRNIQFRKYVFEKIMNSKYQQKTLFLNFFIVVAFFSRPNISNRKY